MKYALSYAGKRFGKFSLWAWIAVAVAIALLSTIRPAEPRYVGAEQIQYSQEIQDWIKSLKSDRQSSPCCDMSDGDFTSQAIRTGADGKLHWWATVNGEWVEIPDEAVVTEGNKLGRPVIWYLQWPGLGGGTVTYIRCFLPGALG